MSGFIPPHEAGHNVQVVAPAGPADGEALRRGMQRLQEWGLKPVAGRHVLAQNGYLAGSDEERAADLQMAFAAPAGGIVAFARGGYGTTRLLPLLDLERMAASGRTILGYSDATALVLALSRQRPYPQLHGPGVAEIGAAEPDYHEESLRAGLLGLHRDGVQMFSGLEPVFAGSCQGIVMGGCLSLLAALAGTPYLPSFRRCILFLEDVNEAPYRLDRMLMQIQSAGLTAGLRGLVLGRFHGCTATGSPSAADALQVVKEWARALAVPVVAGLPAGHGPGRVTIPLGVHADVDSDKGTVVFRHR